MTARPSPAGPAALRGRPHLPPPGLGMLTVVRPRGIFCPNCLKPGQRPYAHARPQPGLRVRYFRCPGCQEKFKTKERLPAPPPAA